jgi:hypothetical protein
MVSATKIFTISLMTMVNILYTRLLMTLKSCIKPYHTIIYKHAIKNRKYTFISLSIVAVSILSFLATFLYITPQTHAASPTTWYVSKSGNDSSGNSWTNAWNELNQINWSEVQPGDTIQIDGGSNGMTYATALSIGKSGTSGNPITIEQSNASGHNGPITIFGGNTVTLPYCGQTSWGGTTTGALGDAIQMNGNSYVTISGNQWDGIDITGFVFVAVSFTGGESNDMLSNLEVNDNGSAFQSSGAWYPEYPGIGFYGSSPVSNLIFNHIQGYDNGEDNFQGDVALNGVTIENSWLHYTRTMPGEPSTSYNLCVHNDGLQLFGSSNGSGLTFNSDVLGPGLTNGFITQPEEDNVTITNTLVIDPGSNVTVENNAANNWIITHDTFVGQDDNLTLEGGTGHQVNHNIFYAGNLPLTGASFTASNNCEYRVTEGGGTLGATIANPEFMTDLSGYPTPTSDVPDNYPAISFLQSADFSLQSGSPCTGLGSSITSVSNFLSSVGSSDTTPPSVPTGLASTATTSSSVALSWNTSTDTGGSGLAGYRLYRGGSLIATISAGTTTYTDTGLSASTQYSYAISAYDNADNESTHSSALLVSTSANSPPPVPGDCNGDSHVTIIDLSLLLSHYGAAYPACDFHNDGYVSIIDLSILLSNYGT